MPQRPLFSVLVPSYNQAPYLGAALDSLLAQSCPDWEAVIVNDGSTDSTAQVLADYSKKDDRFRIYHKENGGPGSALNVGLQHARGEWLCWLSSDDFFDPRKLEIHRDWIAKDPHARFFFSYFREFNEVTGETRDRPLWYPNPEREMQVVEMLHHTYVHGNSICVSRELWSQAGMFDTDLRYGQDYDMWLRLAALSPATFIPERTCVTRVNPLQMSQGFPEAPFYDCAKAGIKFLNQHAFADLFPALDLNEPGAARRAVLKALGVAHNPHSFLYRLGAHPLLLLRITEWIAKSGLPEKQAASLQGLIRRRSADFSRQFRHTPLGFYSTVLNIATQLDNTALVAADKSSLSPVALALAEYGRLSANNATEAATLQRYLERFERVSLPSEKVVPRNEPGEVLFICHTESRESMRPLINAAKSLVQDGYRVALITIGESEMRLVEGVLTFGAANKTDVAKALKSAGALDTLIETPKAEVINDLSARRALVYRPAESSLNRGETGGTVSAAARPSQASDVDIAVSDSANWSDVIERFAVTRHPGKEANAYLLRRLTQVKRKVRNLATQ